MELGSCHERYVRSGPDAVEEEIEHIEAAVFGELVCVVEDKLER